MEKEIENGAKEEKKDNSPPNLEKVKVGEVMDRNPRTISPETSLQDIIELLSEQIGGYLPVTDEENNLIGIVREEDILDMLKSPPSHAHFGASMASHAKKKTSNRSDQIMRKNPISVEPDTSVQELIDVMTAHDLSCVPIVEKGKLKGIIRTRDLIQLLRKKSV